MVLKEILLPEFDHEMAVTRLIMGQVPFEDGDWQPAPTAMSLGTLAAHLADLPGWVPVILQRTHYDIGAGAPDSTARPSSLDALLIEFDDRVKRAREHIVNTSDAKLLEPWTLKERGLEIFTLPKIAALRALLLSHAIHHRGQLSVYLGLRGAPVPAIYAASEHPRA